MNRITPYGMIMVIISCLVFNITLTVEASYAENQSFSITEMISITEPSVSAWSIASDVYGNSHVVTLEKTNSSSQECIQWAETHAGTMCTGYHTVNIDYSFLSYVGPDGDKCPVLDKVSYTKSTETKQDCSECTYPGCTCKTLCDTTLTGQYINSAQISVNSPQISIDSTGGIHVYFVLCKVKGGTYLGTCSGYAGDDCSIMHATPLKSLTLIPGENTSGQELLGGAAALVRRDSDCQLSICQKNRGQSCDLEITDAVSQAQFLRQAVKDAAKKAREKGYDLVVSVDMDLEKYKNKEFLTPPRSNRWHPAVNWAAAVANTVSEAFKEDNPLGVSLLLAHSAGADAAAKSIERKMTARVYDRVFLLNGRTSAKKLSEALGESGYQNWQVKVFTSKGDRPNNPFWSLSDNKAAREYAGKAWTHIHATTFTGHDQLRDNIGTVEEGDFAVNLGAVSRQEQGRAVHEMLMTELRPEPYGSP